MRTDFFYGFSLFFFFFFFFSVLRVASGPRLKLAGRKSALTTPHPTPPGGRSKAVVPVLVLLFVPLWFVLRGY